MFADADDFQEIDEGKLSEIQGKYSKVIEAHEALKGGNNIGYALKVVSGGYGGDVTTIVGISSEGHFTGIDVVSQSETPNLGDRILDESFSSTFVDKTLSEPLKAVAAPAAENEVQLLSGATISSNAVVTAANDAREAFIEFLSDGSIEVAEEEDPLEVLFPDAEDFNEVDPQGDVEEVYEVLVGGEVVAHAIKAKADGFGGDVFAIVGIDLDGNLVGIQVAADEETPGLGDAVEEDDYTSKYEGLGTADEIKVDAITNATVSSEATNKAVNKAREAYLEFFSN